MPGQASQVSNTDTDLKNESPEKSSSLPPGTGGLLTAFALHHPAVEGFLMMEAFGRVPTGYPPLLCIPGLAAKGRSAGLSGFGFWYLVGLKKWGLLIGEGNYTPPSSNGDYPKITVNGQSKKYLIRKPGEKPTWEFPSPLIGFTRIGSVSRFSLTIVASVLSSSSIFPARFSRVVDQILFFGPAAERISNNSLLASSPVPARVITILYWLFPQGPPPGTRKIFLWNIPLIGNS